MIREAFGNEIWRRRSGGRTRRSWGICSRHLHNIPGTKLVKRFIKRAKAEHSPYKDTLAHMLQFVDVR